MRAVPAFKEGFRRDGLDLLGEPVRVDIHHGIVRFHPRSRKGHQSPG